MPKKINYGRFIARLLPMVCLAPAVWAQAPFQVVAQSGGNSIAVTDGATLTLAATAVGVTATITLNVTYVGVTTGSLEQVQLSGPSSFNVSGGTSAALQPGQSASYTLTYTAAAATQATAQLTIPFTETGSVGDLVFMLSGTAPNLLVTYALATNGNVVTVASGSTMTFPSTVVGSSNSATISIVNQGSGSGSIQSIMLSGDPAFSLTSEPLLPLAALAANMEVQFDVVYAPTQTGSNSGTLQIVLANQTVTLGIQGTGIVSLLSYQLVQGGQTSALLPGQTITFPNTNVGATSALTVVAQNTSPTTVSNIEAAVNGSTGSGFSITNEPILPATLNVNQTDPFTITFAPTVAGQATGTFRVGNDSFNLAGTAVGTQLVYSYLSGSSSNTVTPGGTVLFTPQAVGQNTSTTFTVQNTGTTAATITSIGISSAQTTPAFTVSNLPQLPLSLSPNQSMQFTVGFAPQTTGAATALLVVNDQQFTVSGFGNAPPALPGYQFSGPSGTQAAMSQVALGLSLASDYSLALNGTLTITVDSGSLPPDPAVQFSTGGQTVSFTIPQGSTQAVFPTGSQQINLQTGSVAATITITPSFTLASGLNVTPQSPPVVTLSVPTGPVQLVNALVSAESQNALTVSVIGYATTRTLSSLEFQFKATSGSSLSNAAITVNVQANAQAWFSSTASDSFGGQFEVAVPFTLSNGSTSTTTSLLTALQSVSITATNEAGTSNPVTLSLTQ